MSRPARFEKDDPALKKRIAAKGDLEFLKQMDAYADHLEAGSFEAVDWRAGKRLVPDWHFHETWQKYRPLPHKERIAEVISATEHKFFMHYKRELNDRERRDLRQAVRGMVRRKTLRAAYKGLFEWMGQPELFRLSGKLEYADVFPLIYLKMRLEGVVNPHAVSSTCSLTRRRTTRPSNTRCSRSSSHAARRSSATPANP